MTPRPWIPLSLTLWGLLCFTLPSPALAGKVVVLTFSGKADALTGKAFSDAIERKLRDRPIQLLSSERFYDVSEPFGVTPDKISSLASLVKAAQALDVVLAMTGKVSRRGREAHILVVAIDIAKGEPAFQEEMRVTSQEELKERALALIDRIVEVASRLGAKEIPPPPPVVEPPVVVAPPPPPKEPEPKPSEPRREGPLLASVGGGAFYASYEAFPVAGLPPSSFSLGPVPALSVRLEVYPALFFTDPSPAAQLGVDVRYVHAFASGVGPDQQSATYTEREFTVDGVYRLPLGGSLGSPWLKFRAGYSSLTNEHSNADQWVRLTYDCIGGGPEFGLYFIHPYLGARLDARFVMAAVMEDGAQTANSHITFGTRVETALFSTLYRGLFLELAMDLRFLHTLPQDDEWTWPHRISSTQSLLMAGFLNVGYAF